MPRAPPRTSLFWKYFAHALRRGRRAAADRGRQRGLAGLSRRARRLNDILNAEARLAAVKIEDFIDGIRDQLGWTVQLPWSEDDRRAAPARRASPAAPGPGRREPHPGRCRRPRTAVRVAHRAEPDRRRRRSLAQPGRAGARAQRRLVRAGEVPGRLGAVHDDRRRRQSLVGRRGRRRGQPQVHLGGDLRDQGRAHRRRLRARRAGTPRSPIPTSAWCCAPTKPASDRSRHCAAPSSTGRARRRPAATSRARRCWRQWRRSRASTGASSSSSRSPRPSGRSTRRCGARRRCSSPAPCWPPGWRGGSPSAWSAPSACWRTASRASAPGSSTTASSSRPATSSSGWRPASTRWQPSCRSRRSARERISRLKRFLAPQVAELVDRTGDDSVLDGRRVEVVVVFCDLRGFTAFSARADTETVISVLRRLLRRAGKGRERPRGDADQLLRRRRHGAAERAGLGSRSGAARRRHGARHADGTCRSSWPAGARWTSRLGFGVGIAMGPATVGRIGSEGRLDYTADRQRREPRLAPVRQRAGQPDPGGPRRRPGDRCRHCLSSPLEALRPQGIRPARSRVRRQPTGVCPRSGRMSCFESAAYRVRAFEVRTRLALESKATSGTFSPFSSYRMARLLAPILGIIASSRVCAL